MHLLLVPGALVLLTAQVQHAVSQYAVHLVGLGSAIDARIVSHRIDINKDIARHDFRALAVAVVEGDDVGEVVVTDEVDVHLAVYLRRAEYIVYIAHAVALLCGHTPEPLGRQSLLGQTICAIIVVVSNHVLQFKI